MSGIGTGVMGRGFAAPSTGRGKEPARKPAGGAGTGGPGGMPTNDPGAGMMWVLEVAPHGVFWIRVPDLSTPEGRRIAEKMRRAEEARERELYGSNSNSNNENGGCLNCLFGRKKQAAKNTKKNKRTRRANRRRTYRK